MLILLLAVIGLIIVGWSWSKMGGIADYWVDQGKKTLKNSGMPII